MTTEKNFIFAKFLSREDSSIEKLQNKCKILWDGRTKKFLALENFLIGGIVSMELCKIYGKFRPMK